MIFIDTNVLIDILAPGQAWRDWSFRQLEDLGAESRFVVNTIVLAELASGFPSCAEASAWLEMLGAETHPLEADAAFTCGLAFRDYRRRHRKSGAILSDFLIGAHALALGARLLTRDTAIYRAYFPDLALITPESHP